MRRVASCAQLLRRSGFRRLVIDSLFRIVVLCECTACHSLPRNICASLTKKRLSSSASNDHNDTVGRMRAWNHVLCVCVCVCVCIAFQSASGGTACSLKLQMYGFKCLLFHCCVLIVS